MHNLILTFRMNEINLIVNIIVPSDLLGSVLPEGVFALICSRVSLVSLLLYVSTPPTFYQFFMDNGLFQKRKLSFMTDLLS